MLIPLNFKYRKYLDKYDNNNLFIIRQKHKETKEMAKDKEIIYGERRNEDKTERLMTQAYNDGIEAAAQWLEFADRNHTDDAYEVRKLKK